MTRAHRFMLLLPFALVLGCDDCGGDGSDSTEGATAAPSLPDPATIDVPADLLVEVCASEDRGALREALGPAAVGPLAADTRAALTAVSEEAAPFVGHVEPRAGFCALLLRGGEGEAEARLVVAPVARPFEGGEAGAPASGRWLAERVAVIGDALVVGTSRALIEHAGAYAALRLLPAEREHTLSVSVPEGVVPQQARSLVQEMSRGWVRHARAAITEERADHGGPPELGDPEGVVDYMEELAGATVEALSDIGAVRAGLSLEGSELRLVVDASLQPDAPFTERARAWPSAPHRFDTLPRGTALAYFRAGLPEGETTLASVVGRVAGERLGAAERGALEATAAAVHDSPRTLAAGGTDQGSFLLWRARGEDLETVGTPLRQAFAAGYLAMVASAAAGCEGSGSRIAGRASGRCPTAPVSALRGSTFVVAPEGQLLLLEDGPADPAIARVARDDTPVVAAVLVVPSALPGALRLVKPLPPLGDLPQSGAIVLTLSVEDDTLSLRGRAASDAVAGLFALMD